MPNTSERTDIVKDVVKKAAALAAAAPDATEINDFFDRRQPFLQLRQRGKTVHWYVRAKGRSQKIGNALLERGLTDGQYLSIKQARDKAALIYAGVEAPQPKLAVALAPEHVAWTWGDIDREYQNSLTEPRWINNKIKYPKKTSRDDCRLAFGKPPIAGLSNIKVTDLKPRDIILAIDAVHEACGHRQCEKCLAYMKAALNWAISHKMLQSGMDGLIAWWEPISAPAPTPAEMIEKDLRKKALAKAKSEFSVDNMAALLIEHEEFCVGKTANEKISPGIRWGLWWLACTANRRFSTTVLERKNLQQIDEFGEQEWGRAEWPAEFMKSQADFWLPLPPDLLHIANSSIKDWRVLVSDEHGKGHGDSRWVFASSRRIGRDDSNRDVSIFPSSLNAHLRNMRGLKQHNKTDKLKDLPAYWLHLTRAVSSNYLNKCPSVPKSAISLMLAHSMTKAPDDMSRTTREFYVTCQSMPEKSIAMRVWTEALFASYEKQGGKYPMPTEKGRLRKRNSD